MKHSKFLFHFISLSLGLVTGWAIKSASGEKEKLDYLANMTSEYYSVGLTFATEALTAKKEQLLADDHHERWRGLFSAELLNFIIRTRYEQKNGGKVKIHQCQKLAEIAKASNIHFREGTEETFHFSRANPLGGEGLSDAKLVNDFINEYSKAD